MCQSVSRVRLFVTPGTIACRAFLTMEFSRQDWSGLPFPSPGDLPIPGIKPRSPALQADSLPAKPQGKPKNAGVGSLSLLQWIFPTHELNRGLLHCRWILDQLSYEGNRSAYMFCIKIYLDTAFPAHSISFCWFVQHIDSK